VEKTEPSHNQKGRDFIKQLLFNEYEKKHPESYRKNIESLAQLTLSELITRFSDSEKGKALLCATDDDENTPLLMAIKFQLTDIACALANVYSIKTLSALDKAKNTVLHLAAFYHDHHLITAIDKRFRELKSHSNKNDHNNEEQIFNKDPDWRTWASFPNSCGYTPQQCFNAYTVWENSGKITILNN